MPITPPPFQDPAPGIRAQLLVWLALVEEAVAVQQLAPAALVARLGGTDIHFHYDPPHRGQTPVDSCRGLTPTLSALLSARSAKARRAPSSTTSPGRWCRARRYRR